MANLTEKLEVYNFMFLETGQIEQNGKMSASGAGDMRFKFRAGQISHTFQRLVTTVTFKCGPWPKPWSWASLTRDTRKGVKRV